MKPARAAICPNKTDAVREDEPTRLVREELRHADPRSTPYREGMTDGLRARLEGAPLPRPYRVGSAEFDAHQAGIEHGIALYRRSCDIEGGPSCA